MKNKTVFPKIVLISICVTILSFLLFGYTVAQFEDGIVDIAAVQQDEYVQLVLDQINLKENRDEEEIITKILSTLDASSTRYWTFTKEETMLFVKDVLETNKYKGFTSSTYYDSDSAQKFYQNLKLDSVEHQTIHLNDRSYIASGTAFSYNGSTYRLVLLSNRESILENNSFLRGKTELYINYCGLILILLLCSCVLAWKYDRVTADKNKANAEIQKLNDTILKLNHEVFNEENQKVWKMNQLDLFADSFAEHGILSGVTVEISFDSETKKREFIQNGIPDLPDDLLYFEKEDGKMVCLSVYETDSDLKKLFEKEDISIDRIVSCDFNKREEMKA